MDEVIAITKARGFLKDLGIDRYPIDVNAIAGELGFEIKSSNQLDPNEAGHVVKLPGRQIIVVNSNDLPYRQRFTIMHEVAHEALQLPSNHGNNISSSQLESYTSRPREEILCDVFAAECLVPWHLISPLTEELPFEISTIRKLSDDFQASRTCIASRFAQASSDLNIFVLAENGVIRNVVPSRAVKELRFWINIGIKLPTGSAAESALKTGKSEATVDSDGTLWSTSDSASRFTCYEESIVLEKWSQTLSMLTLEIIGDTGHKPYREYLDEDELLPELTGELPWPKR
ncbi:MAG: ImmA/IrrE family metallo-endopeptidase [Sedimenticola sp.]